MLLEACTFCVCFITHGDVKTENILVFKHPQRIVVAKLGDFGCVLDMEASQAGRNRGMLGHNREDVLQNGYLLLRPTLQSCPGAQASGRDTSSGCAIQVYVLKRFVQSFATPWERMHLTETSSPSWPPFVKWGLWNNMYATLLYSFSVPF